MYHTSCSRFLWNDARGRTFLAKTASSPRHGSNRSRHSHDHLMYTYTCTCMCIRPVDFQSFCWLWWVKHVMQSCSCCSARFVFRHKEMLIFKKMGRWFAWRASFAGAATLGGPYAAVLSLGLPGVLQRPRLRLKLQRHQESPERLSGLAGPQLQEALEKLSEAVSWLWELLTSWRTCWDL